MDEFLILLQAKLDEAKSKRNVNADIKKLQSQLDKLKVQVKLDPKSLSAITKQLESALGQKIKIPNIAVDSKIGQQAGSNISQNIAEGINKSSGKINTEVQKIANKINNIQLSMTDKSEPKDNYNLQIEKQIAQLKSLGLTDDEVTAKTKVLTDAHAELKQVIESTNYNSVNDKNQAILSADEKRTAALRQVKNAYEQTKIAYDKYMQPVPNEKAASLINGINSFLKKNTNITDEAKVALQGYADELGRGVNLSRWNEINGILKKTENSMRGLGRLGAFFKGQISQAAQSFTQWLSVSSAVMLVVSQLKKMPKAVYEIDTAMTNLYKVTDETDKKYINYLSSASKSAHELGRSISSLVNQTANWAKLGFSLDEAEYLAKISSIYANVSEVDNETAVSDMMAVMKAFNIEASNSIAIVDKLNKLGNEYASSAATLGEGLSRSASALATAGTDINKSLAMLTGGAEITQNASEFGNFLKIGSMRIRGMKGALEELGEEVDETVDSISKVQTQVLNRTNGKVNIFDNMGNLRDYYDIMEDISKVYNDLSDTNKADLTEILFGKQRGNQGAALIQAFQSGQIQKALETTLSAEGSAMQEQERWMESLETKIQQFETAFQSLSNTVVDSDMLKSIVDLGTTGVSSLEGIVKVLEYINSFGGNIKSFFGTLGAVSGLLMNKMGIGERTIVFQW